MPGPHQTFSVDTPSSTAGRRSVTEDCPLSIERSGWSPKRDGRSMPFGAGWKGFAQTERLPGPFCGYGTVWYSRFADERNSGATITRTGPTVTAMPMIACTLAPRPAQSGPSLKPYGSAELLPTMISGVNTVNEVTPTGHASWRDGD